MLCYIQVASGNLKNWHRNPRGFEIFTSTVLIHKYIMYMELFKNVFYLKIKQDTVFKSNKRRPLFSNNQWLSQKIMILAKTVPQKLPRTPNVTASNLNWKKYHQIQ
ncbi:hypothetical protein V8G54_008152 [Vigna mungo]|uniref:Uncharacterized protein n=1 Tax=Vigna mungo TaxID=3915 RepID=A0AAQ3P4M7_VIGMU